MSTLSSEWESKVVQLVSNTIKSYDRNKGTYGATSQTLSNFFDITNKEIWKSCVEGVFDEE